MGNRNKQALKEALKVFIPTMGVIIIMLTLVANNMFFEVTLFGIIVFFTLLFLIFRL